MRKNEPCSQVQDKMYTSARTNAHNAHKRTVHARANVHKCHQGPLWFPSTYSNLPILVSSPFVITTNMSTLLQLMFRSTMKPFYLSLLLELKTLPRPIISRWGLLVSKKRFDNEVRFEGLGKGEGEEDLKRS